MIGLFLLFCKKLRVIEEFRDSVGRFRGLPIAHKLHTNGLKPAWLLILYVPFLGTNRSVAKNTFRLFTVGLR